MGFNLVIVPIFNFSTQAKLGSIFKIMFASGQAIALGPAGEGEGFAGGCAHHGGNVLTNQPLAIHIANHQQALATAKSSAGNTIHTSGAEFPALGAVFKAGILQQVQGVGIGTGLQLRTVEVHIAHTIEQKLDLHSLGSSQFKGQNHTEVVKLGGQVFAFRNHAAIICHHTEERAGILAAGEVAVDPHIGREGVLACRQHIGLLVNTVVQVTLCVAVHPDGAKSKFLLRITNLIPGKAIQTVRHALPCVILRMANMALEARILQQVDCTDRNIGAVTGNGMNTALFTLQTHIAGVLGIQILAQHIAFVVEGVDGTDGLGRLVAVCLLIGGNYGSAAGSGVIIRIFHTCNESAVLNTKFLDTGYTISGKSILYFIDIVGAIREDNRVRLSVSIGKAYLLAVGIGDAIKVVATVGIVDRGAIGGGNRREEAVGIGKDKHTTCAIGDGRNLAISIGDGHTVIVGIGNLDQAALLVKQAGLASGFQLAIDRIIAHCSVFVLIEHMLVLIVFTVFCLFALFEIMGTTVLVCIIVPCNFTVIIRSLLNQAAHQIQTEAVAHIHGAKISQIQTCILICGVLQICQCAVVLVPNGNRHTIARPGEVLCVEHQIAAGQINAALTEAAQFMGMRTIGFVLSKTGLIVDGDFGAVGAIGSTIQYDLVCCLAILIQHFNHQIGAGRFTLVHCIHQFGNVKGVGDDSFTFGFALGFAFSFGLLQRPHLGKIDQVTNLDRLAGTEADGTYLEQAKLGSGVTADVGTCLGQDQFCFLDTRIARQSGHGKAHVHTVCIAQAIACAGGTNSMLHTALHVAVMPAVGGHGGGAADVDLRIDHHRECTAFCVDPIRIRNDSQLGITLCSLLHIKRDCCGECSVGIRHKRCGNEEYFLAGFGTDKGNTLGYLVKLRRHILALQHEGIPVGLSLLLDNDVFLNATAIDGVLQVGTASLCVGNHEGVSFTASDRTHLVHLLLIPLGKNSHTVPAKGNVKQFVAFRFLVEANAKAVLTAHKVGAICGIGNGFLHRLKALLFLVKGADSLGIENCHFRAIVQAICVPGGVSVSRDLGDSLCLLGLGSARILATYRVCLFRLQDDLLILSFVFFHRISSIK